MSDQVARILFKNSPVALELTSRIVSEVLHIDYNHVINNIKLSSDDVAFNVLNVDSRMDIKLASDTFYVDIEICYTKGTTRQRQTDSYVYQLYLGQLFKSGDYKNMKRVIQIMIENYDFFHENKFVYDVVFMERNLHIVEDDFIRKIHINVAYLRNLSYNEIRKEKDELKRMLYFLVCEDEDNLLKAYKGDEFMEKVVRYARNIAGFENMKLFLPEEEIQRRDMEEARENAIKEGIEQGLKEGIEQGLKEGIEQGRMKQMNEMVINMYNEKYSLNDISKITKLSIEKINDILKNSKY